MKLKIITSLLLLNTFFSFAQDDMMALLDEEGNTEKKKEYTPATFKDTRVINLHSSETVGKRTLQYRISHRFGDVNGGLYQFYGFDGGASMRMGLEYSYDGRFSVGLDRTNIDKQVNGFAKYRLLRQTTNNSTPVSITWLSCMYATTLKDDPILKPYAQFTNRLSYCHQLIIARKFGERVSLQLSPTVVHYNLVDKLNEKNTTYALGFAGRYKLTKRNAITFEYVYRINKFSPNNTYYDHAGIGFDIETGGHVFQFMFVNSFALVENQFIQRNNKTWEKTGVRIGFNISRVFTL